MGKPSDMLFPVTGRVAAQPDVAEGQGSGKKAAKLDSCDPTPGQVITSKVIFEVKWDGFLISSVNLRVEARGTEVGDTFRLVEMRKLESPRFPRTTFRGNTLHPPRPLTRGLLIRRTLAS
jgi:hypothetical protein